MVHALAPHKQLPSVFGVVASVFVHVGSATREHVDILWMQYELGVVHARFFCKK